MARKPSQAFTISGNYYMKRCPHHGLSNHRVKDDKCARCHPSKDKGIGADPEAVARRHTIEDQQERRAEKVDSWFVE